MRQTLIRHWHAVEYVAGTCVVIVVILRLLT